jgi:copper(I)-binding protein
MVQVHTMARQPDGSMKMTLKTGGLTVPAGGSAVLAPGADHIMLIGLGAPLTNGEDVTLAMATASGAALDWTVPVRSFAGAEETYVPEDH